MPRGMYRSRTLRRVKVRTPGSTVHMHYKRRKPSKAKCGSCKKLLGGVPRELPAKMANLAKTKKRQERMYGGVLCPACLKIFLQRKAREER